MKLEIKDYICIKNRHKDEQLYKIILRENVLEIVYQQKSILKIRNS